ncbi:hypothetical protein K466DRAFT_602368 [Polyporus arcularius HHB13444]|uniref:Fungal-type protein kinase domain-containing protein n=1 Tax=Polyporus arcularius HHB13444 TaxID=1314778 RepID=A0A5C3P2Y2_9APHY|nr:hypothetical protein K466DRAFT_602368 [Polyporus arcularius HHB13444]
MDFHLEIDDFVAAFTPISSSDNHPHTVSAKRMPRKMPEAIADMIIDVGKAGREKKVAEAWQKWLNPIRKGAVGPCPGYRLALSQDRRVRRNTGERKVEGAIYRQDELPADGRPHWENQRVFIEFKEGTGPLDLSDDSNEDDSEAELRVDVRGQVTSYAARAFARQHRTAVFLCIVDGQNMCATRWDRSGTVFSASFNYIEQRDALRRLLWGFSRLSDKKQGIDETAVLLVPSDDDFQVMDQVKFDENNTDISEVEGTVVEGEGPWTFRFVRELFKKSIGKGCPRYRLMVPSASGPQYFLVGNPFIVAPGLSGRGTRCYVAYDTVGKRFVFLKDAWRRPDEHVETEGQVLRQLRRANVRNIPTIVCDGELDQETETPLSVPMQGDTSASNEMEEEEEWETDSTRSDSRCSNRVDDAPSVSPSLGNASLLEDAQDSAEADVDPQGPTPSALHDCGLARTFRHYRLVVEEVCLELTGFRSGKQLMSIIRDCVRAHADAVSNAGVIHCDVSGGNILICPTVVLDPTDGKRRVVWKGVLTDWELSKQLTGEGETKPARQPTSMVTWQFASAWILDNPEDAVAIADEMEAFFHVSLYMGLRYMRHNCENLQMTMFDYFDDYKYNVHLKRYLCGSDKRNAMRYGRLIDAANQRFCFLDDNDKLRNHPIDEIFRTALRWFSERYRLKELEDESTSKDELGPNPKVLEALSKQLDDHTALLQLLDSELDDPPPGQKATVWPEMDKVGDQLRPAPAQKKRRGKGDGGTHTGKRVKADSSAKRVV